MSGLRYLEDLQMGHTSIRISQLLYYRTEDYGHSPSSSRRETLSVIKSAIVTDPNEVILI